MVGEGPVPHGQAQAGQPPLGQGQAGQGIQRPGQAQLVQAALHLPGTLAGGIGGAVGRHRRALRQPLQAQRLAGHRPALAVAQPDLHGHARFSLAVKRQARPG